MILPGPIHQLWLSRLVVRSQRGDRSAFRALYRALYEPVYRFVLRRLGRAAEAEEVVAQVFFRLLESLDRVDPRQNVMGYVLQMARNAVADYARSRMSFEPAAVLTRLPSPSSGPLDGLERAEQMEALTAELVALDAETRELLLLRYGDGLRHAEIARMLDLTEAAVRQRTSRAVRELRARLSARLQPGGLPHDA